MGFKLQSAMEYLVTYGWAVLVIGIVLGVMYQYGLFSSAGASGNSCLAEVGYTCSGAALDSNGVLSATIGSSTAITITGTGCSSNSSAPSAFNSVNVQLQAYQSNSMAFSCSIRSTAIGSQFSGTLWIQYDSGPSTGLVSQVATIKAQVSRISQAGGYKTLSLDGTGFASNYGVASQSVTITMSDASDIVVVVATYFYGVSPTISDSQHNTYTSQTASECSTLSAKPQSQIWTTTPSSNGGLTVTVSYQSTEYPTLSVYAVNGGTLSGSVTSTGNNGGACATGSALSVSSFGPAGSNQIVIGGSPSDVQNVGWTQGSGFTLLGGSGGNQYGNSEYSLTTASASTVPMAISSSHQWAESAIAIPPAPA